MALCPERNWHPGPLAITERDDGSFACDCGCVFTWSDVFTWEILVSGHFAPAME